jgi:hypothetical protein
MSLPEIQSVPSLLIRQKREMVELFGFETRNKYSIETESGQVIGFAAEQQKGVLGFLFRQFLGHWRRFHFTVFDSNRTPVLRAQHPFRFFFQRMELFEKRANGAEVSLGALQQRFGILKRKIDIEDPNGNTLLRIESPLWRIWTFPVYINQNGAVGPEVAVISKKWGGLLKEAFLDADTFRVEFKQVGLTETQRTLILAAGIFVDLQYFEQKANH